MSVQWTAAWANAMSIAEHKPAEYARSVTLRYLVTAPFDGEGVRLTFDNFCGTEPVCIKSACIARSDGARGVSQSVPVTFRGSASVTLSAGQARRSDPVTFRVSAGERLAVSFYLDSFTQLRSGVFVCGPLSRGWFAQGDHAAADLPAEMSKTTGMVYFLSEVDLLTSPEKRALVCFGDSITAQNWPDELALIALQDPGCSTAVVRRAASGCRVLRQYSCLQYDSYGLKADVRFAHEFPVPGAYAVIIQEGINDIIHPVGVETNPFRPWEDLPTPDELIEGLRQCVLTARALGMKVYLGTLLPIGGWRTYAPFRDELRCRVNDWMRTCPEADGCIDFDAALRDPADPTRLLPDYDSGDHLHPSAAGYRRMAQEVPRSLLIAGEE